jgi:DNA-binding NtrC family response regulator
VSEKRNPPIRILLVDDDDLALSAYRRILMRDFEVICSESAEEALEVLASSPIDAVFSDYIMPGPNGIWLMEQLRSHHPAIVRVLISGGTVPDLQTHLDSGLVQFFFAKPLVLSVVRECLKQVGLL